MAEKLGLEKELAQVKLELKPERQNKFATNAQKNGDSACDEASSPSVADLPATETKKKRARNEEVASSFALRPEQFHSRQIPNHDGLLSSRQSRSSVTSTFSDTAESNFRTPESIKQNGHKTD